MISFPDNDGGYHLIGFDWYGRIHSNHECGWVSTSSHFHRSSKRLRPITSSQMLQYIITVCLSATVWAYPLALIENDGCEPGVTHRLFPKTKSLSVWQRRSPLGCWGSAGGGASSCRRPPHHHHLTARLVLIQRTLPCIYHPAKGNAHQKKTEHANTHHFYHFYHLDGSDRQEPTKSI